MNNFIDKFQELNIFFKNSNHIDIKTIEGEVSLQEFIASMLSYYPWWMIMLYRIRAVVVRILGLSKQESIRNPPMIRPEEVPFISGKNATFFIVRAAKKDIYWIAETPEDRHLRAYLGVVAEPLKENLRRFYVITIVKYKNWRGPVYFNLIRPFHHLVVSKMARKGVGK